MLVAGFMKGIEIVYRWMSHVDKNDRRLLKPVSYRKLG